MAGGIRERRGDDDLEENHEINVTPFIDVMLVLLIIFMVAAPLSTVDIHVDLPNSTAEPRERADKPIYVTIKKDLSVNVGVEPVMPDGLGAALDRASENNRNARVFVRADKSVDYGDVMRVMNGLRQAGYLKIALVGLEVVPALNAPGGAQPGSATMEASGTGEPVEKP